jgi:hypothetical protein
VPSESPANNKDIVVPIAKNPSSVPPIKQHAVNHIRMPPISLHVPFETIWKQIGMGTDPADPRVAHDAETWKSFLAVAAKREDDHGVLYSRKDWSAILYDQVYPIIQNEEHGTTAALASSDLKQLLGMAERARRARISLYRLGEKTLSAAVHQSGDPTDMGSQQLMLIRDIYHATLQRAKERMRVEEMGRMRLHDMMHAASMAVGVLHMPMSERRGFMLESGHEWKLASNLGGKHVAVFMHHKKFKYRGITAPCILVAVGATGLLKLGRHVPSPDETFEAEYNVVRWQSDAALQQSVQQVHDELSRTLRQVGQDKHNIPVYLCAHGRAFPACMQFVGASRVKHVIGLQPLQLLSDEYVNAYQNLDFGKVRSTQSNEVSKIGSEILNRVLPDSAMKRDATNVASIILGTAGRKRERSAISLPWGEEVSRAKRSTMTQYAKQLQEKVVTFRYDTGKMDTTDPVSCVSGLFGYTTIIYDNNNTGTGLQNVPWPLAGEYIT